MASDLPDKNAPQTGEAPPIESAPRAISPAVRQRLQAVFEHGKQSAAKGEYDYAHDRFTECVIEDPGNQVYANELLTNLAKKYKNNKKGSRFGTLKNPSIRGSLSRAISKHQWPQAFEAGASALKNNPWDTGALVLLAKACGILDHQECQLFYLKWALETDVKDPVVNREAGLALAAMGEFEQAISCWQRVLLAKPGDQEAQNQISRLSVDKTIKDGGYDPALLSGKATVKEEVEEAEQPAAPVLDENLKMTSEEKQLRDAVDAEPAEIDHYQKLADYYNRMNRLADAERVLTKALSASGGDLHVRELLEEAQLRRIKSQLDVAINRAREEKTPESIALARRMEQQANQSELEIYAARASRQPASAHLQFELGMRLKRAAKWREAIQAFQAARDDTRRKAMVQIHLGECFQQIRQFKLAATSYEAAVDACADSSDEETKKLAFYRAGVLASEMDDLDRAEQHFTDLAALDFGYRDVAERLDKLR